GAPNLPSATRELFQSKLMDRLHNLEKQVNDILLFAKGCDKKVNKPFPISQLVAEYQPMGEAALKNNNIDYSLGVEEELTERFGTANLIASALSNWVRTAFKMPGKGPQIAIFSPRVTGDLRISVQDSG
ncbi:histidine kinase, partial [Vibrio parahaemolyticus]